LIVYHPGWRNKSISCHQSELRFDADKSFIVIVYPGAVGFSLAAAVVTSGKSDKIVPTQCPDHISIEKVEQPHDMKPYVPIEIRVHKCHGAVEPDFERVAKPAQNLYRCIPDQRAGPGGIAWWICS
jgi:hypothetical protein